MCLLALGTFAQAPNLIGYQGVARLANGTPISNKAISIKFDLHQGSSGGTVMVSETQTVQTNLLGLFSTQIGKNTSLNALNLQNGNVFLEVSIDTTAASNFISLGTQQMISVPYAMHAASVPSSYTNNILTVGNSTYALSPTVAVTPNTSITLSGIGTVTSTGTNSFDINIPAPSFTNTGQTIISGTYPNFTVNTPTVPAAITPSIAVTTTAATSASVSGSGNSFSINVPPPSFTNTGQPIITGAYPNFTVNTPTVGATPNTSISPSGLVSVSNPVTNSFVIGVQSPTFTNTGQNIITGTYPNFSVNTPTVPAAITPSIALTATAAAAPSVNSSGSSFSLNVPPPAFTNTGQNIITGTYPNFSVNTPTVPAAITPSIALTATAAAAPSVNSSGSSFSLNVPPPAFTNTGQNIITGTYPNFSVNTPTVPGTSIAVTSTAAAGPSVSVIGTNSFNINIPPNTTSWSLLGNAGTTPATNFLGTSDNVVLNFGVNGQKSGTIDHLLNNVFFGYQSGLSNSTGSLNAGFGQEALKAVTTSNRNSAFGYQALLNNTTGSSNTGIGASALRSNVGGIDNTGLGKDALYYNTSGSSNVAIGTGALLNHATGDQNAVIGRDAMNGNTAGSNNAALGNYAGYSNNGSSNVFIGYGAGYNEAGSNKLVIANTSTSVTPLFYGDFSTGRLGINTENLGAYNLTINDPSNSSLFRMTNGSTASNGFVIGNNNTNVSILNYENTPIYFGTNAVNRMVLTNTGAFGIGNSAPTATLHVTGTTRLADGTEGAGKVLTSDAVGNASWQTPASGWGLTGNAGTSTLTNFIGTTDNIPLRFRVNNIASGTIDQLQNNAFFGYQSGSSISTGSLNAGLGHTALAANSTGIMNAAVGYRALNANTSGNGNAAVGSDALLLNTSGIFNVGVGLNAGRGNTTGGQNVALGKDALTNNSTGSNNVSIGYQSGFSSTGSSNVFIGTTAGYYETSSNKLWISNSTTSVTPLVYGDFANNMLGVGTTTLNAALAVNANSNTAHSGIYLSNGRDFVGGAMPVQFDITTQGQTFGTTTYGRIIRLNNSTTGKFYDIGIDGNDAFFITNGNSYSPSDFNISSSGNIGINTASATANLHVTGTTRLVDGNQGAGKVLTSDALGNASWQTATAVSHLRSIQLIPTSFSSSNFSGGVAFSTVGGWALPCIQFPDGNASSMAVITVVMPDDWNGSTISSCKLLYSSPNTSGNFEMSVFNAPISAGATVSQGQSGFPTAISPSSSADYLMEATISLSSITSGAKILNFVVWRNGTSGSDTNTGVLNVYGVKILYND